ncbi:MAG TPA: hypothetical protein VG389_26030 [Myxococcota bacterium]|jgi:hypothetical protein|nr:hypothetical protein [Myxococcota bacterium]
MRERCVAVAAAFSAAAVLAATAGCGGPKPAKKEELEKLANLGKLDEVQYTMEYSEDADTRTEAMRHVLRFGKVAVSKPALERVLDKGLVDKTLGGLVICLMDKTECDKRFVADMRKHCEDVTAGKGKYEDGQKWVDVLVKGLDWATPAMKPIYTDIWNGVGKTKALGCMPGDWLLARLGTPNDEVLAMSFIRGGPKEPACRVAKGVLKDAPDHYLKPLEEMRVGMPDDEAESRCFPPVSAETKAKAPELVKKRVANVLSELKGIRDYRVKVADDGTVNEDDTIVMKYALQLRRAGDLAMVMDNVEPWVKEVPEAKLIAVYFLREARKDPWITPELKTRVDAMLTTLAEDKDSFWLYVQDKPLKKLMPIGPLARRLKDTGDVPVWPTEIEVVPEAAPTPAPGQPPPF